MNKIDITGLTEAWRKLSRPNLLSLEQLTKKGVSVPTILPASTEYFGQCAEDAIIEAFIRSALGTDYDYSRMRYVDVGANHPISTSNSWLFYGRGARGVLVEANAALIPDLVAVRERDRVVCAAARTSSETMVDFYLASKHEVSSTMRPFLDSMVEHKGGSEKGWSLVEKTEVPTVDVNQLIEESVLDGDFVLLSIDTEGADLDVLRKIDIDKYRPQFIVIEPSDEIVGAAAGSEAIDKYLTAHGYACVARTRVNLIYSRPSQAISLRPILEKSGYSLDRDAHKSSPKVDFDTDTPRFRRTAAAIENEKTKVVSFDVFDTVVVRPVLEPKDLFALLNRQMRDETGIVNLDFAAQRAKAESEVRRGIKGREEKRDPTLDEIYNALQARLALSAEVTARMQRIEIEAEINLIYRNEAAYHLFERAKAAGKRVIFCSDTYFSHETIAEMLQQTGYEGYERIFVSSEVGVTKKDGDIFELVCRELQVSPVDILHFGDNRRSDVDRAKERGVRPLLLKSPRDKFMAGESQHRALWSNFNRLDLPVRCFLALFANKFYADSIENDDPPSLFAGSGRRFGYYALGPLVYGLVTWMRREAMHRGIDQIFFLSRDGFLPLKAWNELGLSEKGGPRASYLHISRRAALPLGLVHGDPVPTVFSTPASSAFTVSDFFRSRFDGPLAESLITRYQESGLDPSALAISVEAEMSHFLSSNRDVVRRMAKDQADAALAYYRSQTGHSRTPAIFDVGRKGTFQNLLSRVLDKDFLGFYVLTEGAIADNAHSYAYESFFPQVARHLFPDEPDTVIYESLFSETGPSVIGWDTNLNAVVDENTRADELTAQAIAEIQDGAIEFIRDVKAFFGDAFLSFKFNPRVLNRLLMSFWQSRADSDILSKITHEDSLFHSERKSVSAYYANRSEKSDEAVASFGNFGLKHLVFFCPAMTRIKGGVERVVSLLTFYLSRRGYRITILTSGDVSQKSPKAIYPVATGTEIVHTNVRNEGLVRRQLTDLNPDGLIVLASGDLVSVFAKLAKDLHIPIMLGERAEPSASRETYWRPEKQHRYVKVYNKADVVSVQFPSFRRFFPGLMRRKVVVLPNPISPLRVGEFTARKKIISNVARIYLDQKGQDLLVDAFAKIADKYPDWVVHLYGAERKEDAETLRALIAHHRLRDRVLIKGATSDVQSVFNNSSIFAFPSKFEGFPNALAEALSAGVPAVGLKRCAGTNELIIDNVNGILVEGKKGDEGEINAFAEALERLIASDDLRREMGARATESMSRYEPNIALAQWENGIERMLRRGGRRKVVAPILRQIAGQFDRSPKKAKAKAKR